MAGTGERMSVAWKGASHAVDAVASAPAAERTAARTATATKAWTRAIASRISSHGGEEEERTGEQLLVAFALWRKMKGLFGSDPGLLLPDLQLPGVCL